MLQKLLYFCNMSIPNRQIGWNTESNLLWGIWKQLEKMTKQISILTTPILPKLYGSFYDTTTQIADLGVHTPMKFNTVDIANGVNIELDGNNNPTIISVERTGIYNVQFSSQFARMQGGATKRVTIYLRKGGVDVPWSAGFVSMTANDTYTIASWNYVLELTPSDSLQLMWEQNDAIEMQIVPANTHPASPSVILTVTQVN